MMERRNLICCLVGWFCAKYPNMSGEDMKIRIDNELMESKMTPIGTESGDQDLLQELLGEVVISVLGRGINRKERREGGIKGERTH